jgi:hypothetical protein
LEHLEHSCGEIEEPAGHAEHSDGLVAPRLNLPGGQARQVKFFVSVSEERRRLEAERIDGAGVLDTEVVVKAEVVGGVDDEVTCAVARILALCTNSARGT